METATESVKLACDMPWWTFILRGVFALVIGIISIIWPLFMADVLVTVFGILIFFGGLLLLITKENRNWVSILFGILMAIAGLCAILLPLVTAVVLVIFLGAILLVNGFSDLALAIFHDGLPVSRILVGFTGALSVIVGGVLMLVPGIGLTVVVVVYFGIFAIIIGLISIITGAYAHGHPGVAAEINSDITDQVQ